MSDFPPQSHKASHVPEFVKLASSGRGSTKDKRAAGRWSAKRGAQAEQLAVELLNRSDLKPSYVVCARRANKQEDARGIDVVVYLVSGTAPVNLQIKCGKVGHSSAERQKLKKKYEQSGAAVVKADVDHPATFLARLIEEIVKTIIKRARVSRVESQASSVAMVPR